MKIRDIITESVGRSSQHVEDMVYIEGPAAGIDAVKRLAELAMNPQSLTIKWDGSPAVLFGRNENGEFHFADKHAKNMISTPQALEDMYMDRGRGEHSNSKLAFVAKMKRLHPLFEAATPQGFRGFVVADLLWHSTPPNVRGQYVFEPNTVRYHVDANSPMGKRIGASTAGAAAVLIQDRMGAAPRPIGDAWRELGSRDVVIVPPTSVLPGKRADIDPDRFRKVINHIERHAAAIEALIEPQRGLGDIRGIIYHYINQQAAGGNVRQMAQRFLDWLDHSGKVSGPKAAKIRARAEAHPGVVEALFQAVEETAALKREVLAQLEKPTLASVGFRAELVSGHPGGEGFVDGASGMKLVDRGSFSHANFSRSRP